MPEITQTAKGSTNEVTSREDEGKPSLEKLEITMDKRVDLAVALGIVLVGALVLIMARNIRAGSIPDPIGSRGLANITGSFLIIFGIALAVLRLISWSALPGNLVPNDGQLDEEGYPASTLRYFATALSALLWVWLMKPLGFIIVTPLFMLALILLMGTRSKIKLIFFPTLFSLVLWYAFSQPLHVILPLGPLTLIARSLGLTP